MSKSEARQRVKNEIRSKRGSFSLKPNDGSTLAEDVLVVARESINKVGKDFKVWAGDMIRELGSQIRPYLQKIWEVLS